MNAAAATIAAALAAASFFLRDIGTISKASVQCNRPCTRTPQPGKRVGLYIIITVCCYVFVVPPLTLPAGRRVLEEEARK